MSATAATACLMNSGLVTWSAPVVVQQLHRGLAQAPGAALSVPPSRLELAVTCRAAVYDKRHHIIQQLHINHIISYHSYLYIYVTVS